MLDRAVALIERLPAGSPTLQPPLFDCESAQTLTRRIRRGQVSDHELYLPPSPREESNDEAALNQERSARLFQQWNISNRWIFITFRNISC